MPPGFEWPSGEDRSMLFVAQFNLAEVASAGANLGLPSSGQLYFFFDPQNYQSQATSACVFHSDVPGNQLSPAPIPEDVPEHRRMPESEIEFIPMLQLNFGLLQLDGLWPPTTEEEQALLEEYKAAEAEAEKSPCHHLGGIPCFVQDDGRVNMEIRTQQLAGMIPWDHDDPELWSEEMYETAARTWRNLLQLDTDTDAGFMWGDCGRLYFCMKAEHWHQGDFSQVHADEQGS